MGADRIRIVSARNDVVQQLLVPVSRCIARLVSVVANQAAVIR